VVGACLIPVWAVAAWKLSGTVVPGGLRLPDVDERQVFGATLVDDAADFERVLYAIWAVGQATLLVTLWVYARLGVRFTRESAAGPIGTGMLLGMLGLGIAWLTGLPFAVIQLWWDRRHDVTEVGYLEFVFGDWAALGGAFLSISVALLIVMFLARVLRDLWWIPGAAVFTGIVALFTFVGPYLTTGTHKLDEPELQVAADRFERLQGTGDIPIDVESVSGDTSEANAYAVGFGGTRHVFLWDTLLDGRFTDGEEKTVIAHEIAHHSSGHLVKGIWWFGLFALPGAYMLMLVTRRRGGMGAPEAVPLALFVTVAFYFVLSPVQNLISRRMEAEADWKALESTRDPAAMRGLMRGFAKTSLGSPSPPTWTYILLQTHPTLEQRVAMAQAWAARSASTSRELSHQRTTASE
jgi:STE24 endopeptidase